MSKQLCSSHGLPSKNCARRMVLLFSRQGQAHLTDLLSCLGCNPGRLKVLVSCVQGEQCGSGSVLGHAECVSFWAASSPHSSCPSCHCRRLYLNLSLPMNLLLQPTNATSQHSLMQFCLLVTLNFSFLLFLTSLVIH